MSVCKVCGCDIPRGQKFKTNCYKSYSFCSEKCYNEFISAKQEKPKSAPKDKHLVILKDYINDIWDGQVNWPFVMRQIKSMKKEYDLTSKELYLVLHYAVDYEDYIVNPSYGLGQFVKFIEPAKRFTENISKAKELAKNLPDEQQVIIKKPSKQKIYIKEENWE